MRLDTKSREARDVFANAGRSAKDTDRDLRSFQKFARILSNENKNLIRKYDGQWVGVYNGKVAASAKSIGAVRAKISRAGVPPEQTIFRFIEKTRRTMIL